MGMTLGAALKKIAVAILADGKTLKKVLVSAITVFVALLLPVMALQAILGGEIQLDTDALLAQIQQNLSAEEISMLSGIETTMNAIQDALAEKEMPSRIKEAQALYIMALYNQSGEADFVSKLVSCFWDGQSDTELISAVNDQFGTNISTEEFTHVAQNVRSTYINTSRYHDPTTKNNLDLAQWAIAAEKAGWGYVWGTYGHVLTRGYFDSKAAQYPEEVGGQSDFILANWLGRRTADCVGLIKGYCWFDPEEQTIGYAANGMPDVATEGMIGLCREKGNMDTLPEIPGLLLWMDGHVGVYIGDGYAIEAMGTRYGVVKTQVAGRGWQLWGKLPCIEYIEETEETNARESDLPAEGTGAGTPALRN